MVTANIIGEKTGSALGRRWAVASCLTLGLGLVLHAGARADTYTGGDDGTFGGAPDSGTTTGATTDANSGPVRMARFSVVNGDVTYRADATGEWTTGVRNMPLRAGTQIWVSDGGKAEIQFDDGSRLRLSSNTLVTLQTLYSDAKGEFTEIALNDGLVSMRLTNKYAVYQIDTPLCTVKGSGPSKFRVGAGAGVQVGVRQGDINVEGSADHVRLHAGDYVDQADAASSFDITDVPGPDAWDSYNDERDRQIDGLAATATYQHLPPNIAIAADDLDAYGTWHDDPGYGWIWSPSVTDAGWRPYSAGRWTWVEPFGWTWVSSDPWGWAPYHYGTWIHAGYGWSWCPGPRYQYWTPGAVNFYQYGNQVAWCPLAPREVIYPSTLSLGFHSAEWSLFFSIGGAGVYYPGAHNVCVARPWRPAYVNNVTYVNHVTNITNVYNNNTYIRRVTVNQNTYNNNHFVSVNSRFGGATSVSQEGFGGRTPHYAHVTAEEAPDLFRAARVVGAPMTGHSVAGPQWIRPTAVAFSPTRVYRTDVAVPEPAIRREVFRGTRPTPIMGGVSSPTFTRTAPDARPAYRGNAGGLVTYGTPSRPSDAHVVASPYTNGGRTHAVAPYSNSGQAAPRAVHPDLHPAQSSGGLDDYLRQRNGEGVGVPRASSEGRTLPVNRTPYRAAQPGTGSPYDARTGQPVGRGSYGTRTGSDPGRALPDQSAPQERRNYGERVAPGQSPTTVAPSDPTNEYRRNAPRTYQIPYQRVATPRADSSQERVRRDSAPERTTRTVAPERAVRTAPVERTGRTTPVRTEGKASDDKEPSAHGDHGK